MTNKITGLLDLFAGTGVGVACKNLGIPEYGVEIWEPAYQSREAAGFQTPYRDVWDIEEAEKLNFNALWASPPCQTFSVAGTGSGRKHLNTVLEAIDSEAWKDVESLRELGNQVGDERTALVLSPLTYIHRYRPEYVVLEQVRDVLPIWKRFEELLRGVGYSAWSGILNSKDYGVGQDRDRAFLIASLHPERCLYPDKSARPLTMEDVVGWGFTRRPAPTITGHVTATRSPSGTQKVFLNAIDNGEFRFRPGHSTEPSKVAKSGLGYLYPPDSVNYTVEDALELQSYPRDFRMVGTKADIQQQIGNAVPPKMAEAILKQFM